MILISSTTDDASVFVLLHADDAQKIGVREGDRVTIINNAKGTGVSAPVMLTESFTAPGPMTVATGVNEKLMTIHGESVEVRVASRPFSIEFIRKKWIGAGLPAKRRRRL